MENRNDRFSGIFKKPTRLLAFSLAVLAGPGVAQRLEPAGGAPSIQLVSPRDDARIEEGAVRFVWSVNPGTQDVRFRSYTLTLSANRIGFLVRQEVSPADPMQTVVGYPVAVKPVFKRHGRYYWFVEGEDSTGNRIRSEMRSFRIAAYPIEEHGATRAYPYSIWFRYHHYLKSQPYRDFMRRLNPRSHLVSHSTAGFCFQQEVVWGIPWRFKETAWLYSQPGIGIEGSLQARLLKTLYLAFEPTVRARIAWIATGIQSYSARSWDCAVGGEWIVLPRGYVVVFGGWIPASRAHYSERDNAIRTLIGHGSEFGARFIVPRSIFRGLTAFGRRLDFERIPIEFRTVRLHDTYTGTKIDIRTVGIGYLF